MFVLKQKSKINFENMAQTSLVHNSFKLCNQSKTLDVNHFKFAWSNVLQVQNQSFINIKESKHEFEIVSKLSKISNFPNQQDNQLESQFSQVFQLKGVVYLSIQTMCSQQINSNIHLNIITKHVINHGSLRTFLSL